MSTLERAIEIAARAQARPVALQAEGFPTEVVEAVRASTSAPLFVHCCHCHCRWCQRESGSAFALNALAEADRLRLVQGGVEVVDTPSESGRGQHTASKQPWVVLAPDVPAVAEYEKASERWPRESVERRAALRPPAHPA
jgi:hypothetical protein